MLQKASVSDFKNVQAFHTVRSKVRLVLLIGTRLVFLSNKQVIKGKFHVKARCPALEFCNDAMRPWRRELPDLSPLRVLQGLQAESLRFLITETHTYTHHVWQHASPPRYYPQENKIMHVDGMLWTANSYASWRYQVPISFSAKLNQTQQIAWKMCYSFTFLELTKSEVCVQTRQICLYSFCLFD